MVCRLWILTMRFLSQTLSTSPVQQRRPNSCSGDTVRESRVSPAARVGGLQHKAESRLQDQDNCVNAQGLDGITSDLYRLRTELQFYIHSAPYAADRCLIPVRSCDSLPRQRLMACSRAEDIRERQRRSGMEGHRVNQFQSRRACRNRCFDE